MIKIVKIVVLQNPWTAASADALLQLHQLHSQLTGMLPKDDPVFAVVISALPPFARPAGSLPPREEPAFRRTQASRNPFAALDSDNEAEDDGDAAPSQNAASAQRAESRFNRGELVVVRLRHAPSGIVFRIWLLISPPSPFTCNHSTDRPYCTAVDWDPHVQSETSQIRYLIVEVECGIAEAHNIQALREHRRTRDWAAMAEALELAFNFLRAVLISADPWNAVLLQADDGDSTQLTMHRHSHRLLGDVINAVDLVRDHTEEARDKAVLACHRRIEQLNQALFPEYEERDAAKERFGGEEKWKANSAPKYDYAEARRAKEEELRVLEESVERLNALLLPQDVQF